MGDTTFNVLDSAGATATFRAQAVVGTTLVMMSVPSDTGGTAIIGQKTMASSLSVAFASNQSTMTAFLAGGTVTLAGGTALVTLAGGTALVTLGGGTAVLAGGTASVTLAGGTASVNITQVSGTTLSLTSTALGSTDYALPVVLSPNGMNANGLTTSANCAPVVLASDQVVSTNLTQVGAVAFSLGQKVMATSIPVAIASNQSAIPVTGVGGTSTVTLAGGTALVTLAGGTTLLAGGTTSVNLNQVGGSTFALGQSVMATSLSVAIATNQASVSIAHDSNALMNGASGSVMTPKFALIAVTTTSGVNQVVTAVSSKKIRVVAWDLVANGAVNFKWQSNTADLTGLYYMAGVGNGVARGWNPNGYFETAAGTTLNVNLSATVAVGGCLTYVEV